MRSAALTLLTACLLSFGLFAPQCGAQEFRIETDVFVDDQKQPVVETLTIFSNGAVYDFLLTGVEEITFFDRDRDRLVLMDTKRKVKTELTMGSILQVIAQMKTRLAEQGMGKANTVDYDPEGRLILSTDHVTYRAEGTKPKETEAAVQYQQFADWYARLNALRMGNPPFVRIQLNAELASEGKIPKTIERTTVRKGLRQVKQTLRSRHLANWRLSNTDRKMIDRAATHLATYPTVSFRDYVQLPVVASK